MRIEDLEVGDIVLDSKHSGIYVGVKNGKPYIVHALSSGYHGANVRCTSFDTFFKACNAEPIMVFRAKNTILSRKAADYAYQFGLNKDLPFDDFRLIQANTFSDKIKHSEQKYGAKGLDILHESFMLSGLFRAIKFASRRDINLLKKNDSCKPTRGLRCAFFVCLCYQIAALADLVEALPKESKQWVSNKHIDKNLIAHPTGINQICHRYLTYTSRPKLNIVEGKLIQQEAVQHPSVVQNKNPNSKLKHTPLQTSENQVYNPSIFQWRGKENLDDRNSILQLADRMTLAMMVDAKYCTAHDLISLLDNDKSNWMLKGYLQSTPEQENQSVQIVAELQRPISNTP